MSEATAQLVALPTDRPANCPFDPPPELVRHGRAHPISRMLYPDGHLGWLVTTPELVCEVLADPRFSARAELRHDPLPGASSEAPHTPPPGVFVQTDPPQHTRYRHLLTGQFTVHRMKQLIPRIQRITAEVLDAIEQDGPPADLVEAFALPIPSLVICELLGVPSADRERFQQRTATMMRLDTTQEETVALFVELQGSMRELVAAKRAQPTDDLLAGLVGIGELTDEELANIGFMLLGAGFETTANMLALGVFALLEHPDQLAALRAADPDGIERAVEELLRYLSIIPGTVRAATEDVELGGVLVRAGESVTVSIPMANRDPAHFPDPDRLDLHRSAGGHVAFGHGIHQCLGQQLARVELRIAYPALLRRFPTLRLAVPPEEVPLRTHATMYGVAGLPVTW